MSGKSPSRENLGRHFICGMCGGAKCLFYSQHVGFATTITLHPLDCVKTRLQVNQGRGINFLSNFFRVVRVTYQEGGVRAFYQGLSPAVLGSVTSWSIYFACYENAKNRYKRLLDTNRLNGFYNLISSLEAGIIGSTATCPLWFLKTRLQLQNRLCLVDACELVFIRLDAWICSL